MKGFNGLILSLIFILFLTSNTFSRVPMANYDPHSLVIKLKSKNNIPQHPLIKSSRYLFKNYYAVWTNQLTKLEKDLKRSNKVEWVEKNYKSEQRPLPTPQSKPNIKSMNSIKVDTPFNDPGAENIWSHYSSAGIQLNHAYRWPDRNPFQTIIVAVVDTGIEYTHEDLIDVMWINPGEIADNGIDDDNNGYIDDIYGINPLKRQSDGTPSSDPRDYHGHGTHVAGIIGATQNNNIGVAGIASNVLLMAIRAVPGNGDETDVDVSESFLYAAKNGAKIINCSFGKRTNEGGMIVSETIKYIGEEYGVLVVAAAGNESRNIDRYPIYPGSFPNQHLLTVGATSSVGRFDFYSNYGIESVDVAAPGSGIYSTLRGNGYTWFSGTSMASPTTAGVAAELMSNYPHLGPLDIKRIIIESVTKIGTYTGYVLSGGRVNLLNALKHAQNF